MTRRRAELSVGPGKMDDMTATLAPADPLDGFTPATATWFREVFAEPTERPARGLEQHRGRAQRAGRRAHRFRQDAGRLPLGAGRAGPRARAGAQGALPRPLRLPAQGAGGRRRAQPARPADRDHPDRAPRSARRRRASPSACAPATPRPAERRAHREPAAGHPHHHARVAVPDAHLVGARGAALGPHGDRRRGARAGGQQAGRPPRRVDRAARGADRRSPAPERPLQRIGLSATVRPASRVAAYLGGPYDVDIVAPPAEKRWDLDIVVPVEDMSDLGASAAPGPVSLEDEQAGAGAVDLAARGEPDPRRHLRRTARRSSSPTRAGSPSG